MKKPMAPVTSIPVRIGRGKFFDYWIGNLFSKWGNGDGDDPNLCDVACTVLDDIGTLGYEMETGWGIHNGLLLCSLKRGGKEVWANDHATDSLWEPEEYGTLWSSLPRNVQSALTKLARDGVRFDTARMCLLHGAWTLAEDHPCRRAGVLEGCEEFAVKFRVLAERNFGFLEEGARNGAGLDFLRLVKEGAVSLVGEYDLEELQTKLLAGLFLT